MNVATTDGALTKTAGCDGCPDAGARAAVSITGDGYVEYSPVPGYLVSAGLSADPAAPLSAPYDFAFNTWPGGSFEIRERGAYKSEGGYAAGDRLKISVESGKVVFRKNGLIIYTSQTTPAPALTFGVTLFTAGASMHDAVIGAGGAISQASPPPPTPIDPPSGVLPSGLVSTGPYRAIVDRVPYAKPTLPAPGPAGSTIVDPTFSSKITRVTDGATRPGYLNRSYRSPSSPHQNAWSANNSYFYVVSGDGSIVPFRFDQATRTATRVQPSASGDGGLVLKFYIEPQFSYVNDSLIYGSLGGVIGATLRTIDQFDFSTGSYTRLLDLDTLVPGLQQYLRGRRRVERRSHRAHRRVLRRPQAGPAPLRGGVRQGEPAEPPAARHDRQHGERTADVDGPQLLAAPRGHGPQRTLRDALPELRRHAVGAQGGAVVPVGHGDRRAHRDAVPRPCPMDMTRSATACR